MTIESAYYNHYNIKCRYTPERPEIPDWKEKYVVTEEKVKSNNYSQDSDAFKAYTKLEEIYYPLGVSNRAKYRTEVELYAALSQKYYLSGNYKGYSYSEIDAMYSNELKMTLYGCLNTGGNVSDPHLKRGVMDPSNSEQKSYNRNMVNVQLGNIFSKAGLSSDILVKYNMTFTIDPLNYKLKVSGVDDKEIADIIEKALNTDNNSRELFYHIMNSNSGSISKEVLSKYHALRKFKSVTGQDLRDYKQTALGMVNEKGENALDVYKEALKTTNVVPALFKGDAYRDFAENIEKLLAKDFSCIPDLNLSIEYKNGILYDLANESVVVSRFQASI